MTKQPALYLGDHRVPRYGLSRLDKLIPSEWQAPNFMVIIIVIISSINLRRPPILRTAYPYHLVRESQTPISRLR